MDEHSHDSLPSTLSNCSILSCAVDQQPTNSALPSGSNTINNLDENCWYWGAANKDEITTAMENHQNGTFAVRDSSAEGQYTLTLRIDGANKLVKILVGNERCGFTNDSMDFDSVASLIQFYQTCSLKDFNEKLDTCLLFPLKSPKWLSRQNKLTSSTEVDPAYHLNLLKFNFEALHSEYNRVSRRYDQLFNQKNALTDECTRKQQTESAYGDALRIFERKIGELKTTISEQEALVDRDQEALTMNIELQLERMEEIKKAQNLMKAAVQNIGRSLQNICEELEELKPRLLKLHKKCDKYRIKLFEISNQKITHAQLDRLVQSVSLSLDIEHSSLSVFLLRISLPVDKWHCGCWLWHQSTKEESTSLIRELIINAAPDNDNTKGDGIFLIRPSTSRSGFFALEVSKDGNVHSCLVEYRDPRTSIDHRGGYGFAQTQMLFASLMDFVRYYSCVSLKEHNSFLDTTLKTPALGQIKSQRERHSLMTNCFEREEV